MHTTMSIRDLGRSGPRLQEFDYIDLEDKKSHEPKGVFIPERYAAEVRNYMEEKLKARGEARVASVMAFAGMLDGETKGQSIQELKAKKEER